MAQDIYAQLLILYLTSPKSDFYLSKLISGSVNPTLEPFEASFLDLGTQLILGEKMDFSLLNLKVIGVSNVQVEKKGGNPIINVNGENVAFTAITPNTEAPPSNVPSELTMICTVKVTPVDTPSFSGGLTVTVKTATIGGEFNVISKQDTVATVGINFSKLLIDAQADSSNIKIDLKMDSPYVAFIESILSQSNVLSKIVSVIGSKVNEPDVLKAISGYATLAARKALKNL